VIAYRTSSGVLVGIIIGRRSGFLSFSFRNPFSRKDAHLEFSTQLPMEDDDDLLEDNRS
jgi:hypothetical protein